MGIKTKLVIPTAVEFIRYISGVILQDTKAQRDTSTELTPIVTRAKSLTEKKGLFIAYVTDEGSNG